MTTLEELLAEILEVEPGDIRDDSSPQTIPSWDSFTALMMVSELEGRYNVKFTTEEITSVTCVADIKAALARHGVTTQPVS